jgi:hypothetical protein
MSLLEERIIKEHKIIIQNYNKRQKMLYKTNLKKYMKVITI